MAIGLRVCYVALACFALGGDPRTSVGITGRGGGWGGHLAVQETW